MSSLDNLTAKILNDAKEKAAEIVMQKLRLKKNLIQA